MASGSVGRVCAAGAALLLAAGCDLTLPWSGSAPGGGGNLPDGPRELVASADPLDFDLVRLTWTPSGYPAQYEVQGRVGGGAWQTWAPFVPGGVTAFAVRIDPTLPERTALAFRLRAVIGGSFSGWSNDAAFPRGIRPPSSVQAEMGMTYTTRTGPVAVTWVNASQVATAIALERATVDGAGLPTTWAPLADVSLGSGAYVDHRVEDGRSYAYRVRVGADGLWSAPREAQTPPVDLAAPWGLRAVVEGDAVRLRWTNQSATAEALSVARCFPDCFGSVAELPPASDGWVDALPVWPVTAYQVTASRPSTYQYATTGIAAVEPFTLAGPPALAASGLRLPEGEWVARDDAGRLHVAQHVYETPRLHRATAAGHETHVLPGAFRLADPGVLLDAAGAPHTVYLRYVTGPDGAVAATEVVHAWWDGGAWRSEIVATDDVAQWSSSIGQAWFGLDAADGLQVLYRRAEPFPARESLVHVARGAGGWTATAVATPSVPDFSRWSLAFAVAPDGAAYVAQLGQSVARSANLVVLCTRSPAGAWSDELVPAGAFDFHDPWLMAGSGGEVALAHTRGFAPVDVVVLRKRGGTWSAPEVAVARTPQASSLGLAVAPASGEGRLALAVWSLGSAEVVVRDEAGWRAVKVGPSNVLRAWLGFGRAGSAWALFPHDSATFGQAGRYSLFEEVR